MTRIIADISISIDGFVTGPDPGPDNGLGTGGEPIHAWAFSDHPEDRRIMRESTANSGAVVLGRRLFDVVDAPSGWNDEVGFGAREVGKPAFIVVTKSPPETVRLTNLNWTFVTGLADAIGAARERAEAASVEARRNLDVVIMGGGTIIRSALAARVLETLVVHVSPIVMGAGTPLFTSDGRRTLLVQREVVTTPTATHLTYDVPD